MRRPDLLSLPGRATLTALLLAVAPCSVAYSAEPENVRRELGEIRLNIEQTETELQRRQREAAEAEKAAEALRQRLIDVAATAQQNERSASEAEDRLEDLNAQLSTQQEQLAGRKEDIATTLSALVRIRRQPPVLMMLHSDNAVASARSFRLLTTALPHLQAEAEDLRQQLTSLAELRQEVDREQRELQLTMTALQEHRDELSKLIEKQQAQASELNRSAQQEKRRLAALARKAGDLDGLLQRLERDRERQEALERERREAQEQERRRREAEAQRQREEEARRLAAEAERRRNEETVRAAAEAARAAAEAKAAEAARREAEQKSRKRLALAPSGPFSQAQGRLALPVQGRIVHNFGERNEFGQRSQGMTLLSRAGAEVIAPHDGRIVFAGPFRDYGVILIIAHGEGYHTLLAGLTEIYVVVGQTLLTGEPVGQMGSGKNRTLYVELRREGEAINPRPWWASNGKRASG